MPNTSSKNEPGAGTEAPRGLTSPDQAGTTESAGSDFFMSRFLRFSLARWMGLFALVCALLFARFPEPLIKPWTFANEVGAVYFQDAYIHPRIIKGTLRSAKRKQIRSDRFRMLLHFSEDP